MNRITRLLSMIGLLALAYGLDRASDALHRFRTSTFRILETVWVDVIIELVFAGALVLLAWLVLVKSKRDVMNGSVFVITGLLAFFIANPFGRMYFNFIPHPLLLSIFLARLEGRLFGQAGAFIAMLGLADLLSKTRSSASA